MWVIEVQRLSLWGRLDLAQHVAGTGITSGSSRPGLSCFGEQ